MFFAFLGTCLDTFENWTLWDCLERLPLAQTLLHKERTEVSGGKFGTEVLTDTRVDPVRGQPSSPFRAATDFGGSWKGTRTPRSCDLLRFHSLETSGDTWVITS